MKKIFSALTTLVILVVLFGCTSNLSNDKIDVVDFNILIITMLYIHQVIIVLLVLVTKV